MVTHNPRRFDGAILTGMTASNLPPAAAKYEDKLRQLVDVFLRENEQTNLSALRTAEKCWIGNVLDSLAVSDLLLPANTSILDLGTGGGFPLLPLSILYPDRKFTGVDSIGKKINAIQRICLELELKNVQLMCSRFEDLGRDPVHREQYDVVLARAVAELPVLLEYCAPFVKFGGRIILWKSLSIDEEFAASKAAQSKLHCPLTSQLRYTLPGDFGERQLLVFTKSKAISSHYPRAVGIPKKSPLR